MSGEEKGATVEAVKDSKTSTEETPKQPSAEEIEKQQEAQLRSKYPGLKGPGSSSFLQKRLSKGTKYFDSGDYNMAKAKVGPPGAKPGLAPGQKLLLEESTGDAIPTPDTVPHKKINVNQSKLVGMS